MNIWHYSTAEAKHMTAFIYNDTFLIGLTLIVQKIFLE